MRVLMFGWEFPPHITGGLGTACFGMTKGLAKNDVDVLFVVPRAYGDEDETNVRLLNASDVTIDIDHEKDRSYWERVQYMEIGSNIIPYVGPENFANVLENDRHVVEHFNRSGSVFARNYQFSGKYGMNLMEEVARYALIGSSLATKYDFDVIHAHDWLTYSAGIAAKETTGKPLVVHMHATEFDRSGENINTDVYAIERRGMEAADRVITVSNLTRNIVINKYGIDPAKVVTVHNAVEPNDKPKSEYERSGLDAKVVTFLGRITYQKGPEYFIEAAYKIHQVPLHGLPEGRGRRPDVRHDRRVRHAVHLRAVRHRAVGGHASQCASGHQQAVGCLRGRQARLEGRLLGYQRLGRCHLWPMPLQAFGRLFQGRRQRRGGQPQMGTGRQVSISKCISLTGFARIVSSKSVRNTITMTTTATARSCGAWPRSATCP